MSTSVLPKKYWIYEKKHYYTNMDIRSLPHVKVEYECILKANGIPYRKTVIHSSFVPLSKANTEVCEYWNPEKGLEEEALTLPLFVRMPDGSYQYCEKSYTKKIPTNECLEAANALEEFVTSKVTEFKHIQKKVASYQFIKKQIADNLAVVVVSNYELTDYVLSNSPDVIGNAYSINMKVNHDDFALFEIRNTNHVVIFNMNKIAKNGHIHLFVPEHIAGLVIGRDHSNISSWAKQIGVKEIHVIPI